MFPLIKFFEEHRFIAVIRSSSADDADAMIRAAMDGGFRLFEISMQTAQASRLLEAHSKKEDCLFGASMVTDGEMAQRAIKAGAKFISSPFLDRDVVAVAKHNDTFVIQGAMTPTEALNASQFGADLVQIYPAGLIGGPEYLKTIRAALPALKFMAGGSIPIDTAFSYLKDCVAVALGKALFDKTLLRADNWTEIAERARQLTQKLEALKVSK